MAEAATQQSAPVVKPVQAKKIKVDGKKIAYFNTFALSFATFFGVALIFNTIGALINHNAKKANWYFDIPFLGSVLSFDIANGLPSVVLLAFLVLALAIAGLVTVSKITDAESLKKSWCVNAKVFMAITALFGVSAIATAIYSLMSIKKGAGKAEGSLWLNGFLPTAIMGAVSFGIAAISKAIANGKTALVRVMSYIAISVASIAFIMMFIDQMIYLHKKSSSSYDYDDLLDGLDSLNNLLK